MPTVTVELVEDECVEVGMKFTIIARDDAVMRYTYTVWEADLLPLAKWRAMCDGIVGMYPFYQGNGDGYIQITDDGMMQFVGAPSGAGGDVKGTMSIPHAIVKPQLESAVALAQERGLLTA
jgi:hypothetical protein